VRRGKSSYPASKRRRQNLMNVFQKSLVLQFPVGKKEDIIAE